jgi:hypothetical protein
MRTWDGQKHPQLIKIPDVHEDRAWNLSDRAEAVPLIHEPHLLLDFQLDRAPTVDGFATEAPVGTNLESRQLALPEEAIDGRRMQMHQGMHLQEVGKFADGHEVAWRRLFYPLIRCQNQRGPFR